MSETRPPARRALIFQRLGRNPRQGRWLECGTGRVEADGSVNVFLNRLPLGGGWSGHVHLAAPDGKPPSAWPAEFPLRPGLTDKAEDEEEVEAD